jgi:hypothetical protein
MITVKKNKSLVKEVLRQGCDFYNRNEGMNNNDNHIVFSKCHSPRTILENMIKHMKKENVFVDTILDKDLCIMNFCHSDFFDTDSGNIVNNVAELEEHLLRQLIQG